MIRSLLIGFGSVAAVLAAGFGAFVLAVEHPATKGHTRCWLQETFYTQEWADPPAGTAIIEASFATERVRGMCDAADVEGLAIYAGDDRGSGYLVASSQGDNTYAVYDRAAPHAFKGRFQVRFEGVIVGDTDGLEVTSIPLGEGFPSGILVVQDGMIRDASGARRNQRFAVISWAEIEAALGL